MVTIQKLEVQFEIEGTDDEAPPEDELYEKAKAFVKDWHSFMTHDEIARGKFATVQGLQAHLKIGYTKADALMDKLRERGVVN